MDDYALVSIVLVGVVMFFFLGIWFLRRLIKSKVRRQLVSGGAVLAVIFVASYYIGRPVDLYVNLAISFSLFIVLVGSSIITLSDF